MPRLARFTTILLFALLAARTASAQGSQVGITAGFAWTWATDIDYAAVNATEVRKLGFVGGVFAILPLDQRRLARTIAFQPEALIAQKGARGHSASRDNLDWSAEYLEIPLLFRFGTLGRKAGLFAVAGPGVSIRLTSHGELPLPDAERVDVNLLVGAGVATGEFTVEIRYDAGLRGTHKSRAIVSLVHVRL